MRASEAGGRVRIGCSGGSTAVASVVMRDRMNRPSPWYRIVLILVLRSRLRD